MAILFVCFNQLEKFGSNQLITQLSRAAQNRTSLPLGYNGNSRSLSGILSRILSHITDLKHKKWFNTFSMKMT
jgi:hypothetical protein